MHKLYNDDCLKVLDKLINDNVLVDSVICDPPYGTTACEWDLVIPENELIPRLYKVIKPNGWLILFGNSPFYDRLLVKSTNKYDGKQLFKYSQEMIWEKHAPSNPLSANQQLMRKHEKIMILTINKKENGKHQTYNPYTKILLNDVKSIPKIFGMEHWGSDATEKQNERNKIKIIDLNNIDCLKHTNAYKKSSDQIRWSIKHLVDKRTKLRIGGDLQHLNVKTQKYRDFSKEDNLKHINNRFKIPKVGITHLGKEQTKQNERIDKLNNGKIESTKEYIPYTNYPTSIFKTKHDYDKIHPTQKPLALMTHLVKLFTNENDWVLDFTMGSGSTGVACVKNNRNFIGIELNEKYFNIAKDRIEGKTPEKELEEYVEFIKEKKEQINLFEGVLNENE